MAVLKPLDRAGLPEAEAALGRLSARIGYRPNALATIARRPEALMAVLSLIEEVVFRPGASAVGLRWMAAYATCVGAGCSYSGAHAAHGAVEAGEALSRVVAAAHTPSDLGFTPSERALFKMAAEIGRTGSGAAQAGLAHQVAGEAVLAEITLVCATFGLFNRWNRTMQTEVEADLQYFAADLASEIFRHAQGQG